MNGFARCGAGLLLSDFLLVVKFVARVSPAPKKVTRQPFLRPTWRNVIVARDHKCGFGSH
jgi:hypothetical protein